ncbi:MAG TPA: metallophosphoesterase [Actinomycetota bacterium]|nr:metallophosphoesterase [Actinomycetota bacterium]
MIRIAAVGDLHAGEDSAGTFAPDLDGIEDQADALLLAGDLTTHGRPAQAEVLASELRDVPIPVIAVLGNHDHHEDRGDEVAAILADAGVAVLERTSTVVSTPNGSLAVVGAKGFGGGFAGACATEFGEPEMKTFVRVTADIAHELEAVTRAPVADARVVLLHYSPVRDTLVGEPPEIYPFLGSYLLAEAVDRAGADLILHGHAHRGAPAGTTAGGIPVRNVARPVLRRAFGVFTVRPRVRDAIDPIVSDRGTDRAEVGGPLRT